MDNTKQPKTGQPTVKLNDINFTPIFIALFVVFITIAIFFLWKKKSVKRTSVLLTGLCESGKTLLFSQILYEELIETFTSITENVGEYSIEGSAKVTQVVDIPGHERLRIRFFDQYKSSAKGVVYVVDSVSVQKDIRDVADFLYTILADSSIASQPILIACNKQDETLAKGSSVVKALLEKELNLVRNTRQSQLKSVDNSTNEQVFLGKPGKDFEFSHLSQSVEVVECSSKEGELDTIHSWLQQL